LAVPGPGCADLGEEIKVADLESYLARQQMSAVAIKSGWASRER
jgi:kynurenine formamidase